MYRRFVLAAALFAVAGLLPTHGATTLTTAAQPTVVAQTLPPVFLTESAAQARCPKDVVVWLNIPSGIYHYKGERWYGRWHCGPMP